jgi:hypothetical protein
MAKVLQNIFSSGDRIAQGLTVQSWHVSQSVDAFTGADDYDITISGSLTVIGPTSGSFTGSLLGTSSWADNAVTASYILNAVSSSFSSTASYVENAQTASYVLNAVSSSFSSTASFVNPLNQNVILTGSLDTTGSVALRGLTTSSQPFLVTINDSTGQLFYTSAVGLLASASQPSLPLNSFQYNNAGTFAGTNRLTFDGTTLRATGSFTGSFNGSFTGAFTGNLTGTSSWASLTNDYTINYNNNTNSSFQILWGSGTRAYGNGNVTVNPNTGYVTANSYVASDWFRSSGTSGWFNSTYEGGIWMYDSTWVRTYNNKSFFVGNTGASSIATTGDVTAFFSDERLKEKISNVDNALDKVLSLNGFYYKNNNFAKSVGYTDEDLQLGLSAQEIQKVAPEIVKLAPFDMETDKEGNITSKSGENYLTVNYAKLVPILVEAIKDQQKQIEELKSKIG